MLRGMTGGPHAAAVRRSNRHQSIKDNQHCQAVAAALSPPLPSTPARACAGVPPVSC